MKLRTSCFKPITLKKDIFRFAPVWALYLIGMMLVLLGNGYSEYSRFAKYTLSQMLPAFAVVNLGYALIIGMLLFGDLFNTKMCYSLHAMPYRRESWLATHLVSGLLFSLVPNAIACLYLMVRLEAYWFLALYWYLAITLQFLFFYGIAAVSAMLTGSRFAMLAVYAIFNFVAMLLYFSVNVIYAPMLEGVVVNTQAFTRFSPVVELFSFEFFLFERENRIVEGATHVFFIYKGLGTGWGYTAILSILGLVAMGVAFWLYRKRHLECAGDFVAFPRLKGAFCIILTLCVTLVFALAGKLLEGLLLWIFVGLFVGFFGSLMLLERRVKVFRKGTWLGFAAMVVVVALSVCAMAFDWLGIESWTPSVQQVQSVQVSNSSQYDIFENGGYGNRLSATLEDPADIDRIIQAHEDILGRLGEMNINGNDRHRVTLVYKLKSGRTVVRSYYAPASGTNYQIIRSYLYRPISVLGFADAAAAAKNITYFYCDKGPVPPALYEEMLEALMGDAANGTIDPQKYGDCYVEYEIRDGNQTIHRYMHISDQAEKTLELMKSPEMAMGYDDWATFLAGIESMQLDGEPVSAQQWTGLLEALRKDIEAGTVDPDKGNGNGYWIYYEYRMENGEYAYREFIITEKAQNVKAWLEENLYTPAEE